jgi:hypothetical protein
MSKPTPDPKRTDVSRLEKNPPIIIEYVSQGSFCCSASVPMTGDVVTDNIKQMSIVSMKRFMRGLPFFRWFVDAISIEG